VVGFRELGACQLRDTSALVTLPHQVPQWVQVSCSIVTWSLITWQWNG